MPVVFPDQSSEFFHPCPGGFEIFHAIHKTKACR
jgi:hypothetical protein